MVRFCLAFFFLGLREQFNIGEAHVVEVRFHNPRDSSIVRFLLQGVVVGKHGFATDQSTTVEPDQVRSAIAR